MSDIALIIAELPQVDLMVTQRAEMYRKCIVTEENDSFQEQRCNQSSRKTDEKWQRRYDIANEGR